MAQSVSKYGLGFVFLLTLTLGIPAAWSQNPATGAVGAQPHPDSAVAKSLAPPAPKKGFFDKAWDRLASLDIKWKANVLDIEIIEGLRAAVDYRYNVEPSYDGEFHLRYDRATVPLTVNVGQLFGKTSQYFGVTLSHSTEILYVRPFKSKSKAILAVPFGYDSVPTSVGQILERLPLSADNAIKNLAVGDFFSVSAYLNLIVSAASLPLSATTRGFIATHYLISGQFQIHLVKAEDQKLEIKIIALRKTDTGVSAVAGFGSGHKVFGLSVVDRRIEKWLNLTDVFQISYGKLKSNLMMVNYMLDMKDPRVRDAYDGIAAKLTELATLETVKILDPRNSNSELTSKLISDITPFETIYASEKYRIASVRTVDRRFKGKNDVDVADRSGFRFAPVIMKFTKDTEYFENVLTSSDADEKLEYYRLHTFVRTNAISWWGTLFKATSLSRASILFDSDVNGGFDERPNDPRENGSLRDIVFEWDYRDKVLTAAEMKMIKDGVRQAVPESVHKGIDWGSFVDGADFENARFNYKMVLHPSSLKSVAAAGEGNIYGALLEYLKTIPEPSSDPQESSAAPDSAMNSYNPYVNKVEEKYKSSLQSIAHYLAKVANPNSTMKQKADAFAELRFNNLFIEIGPGFLVSVLPQANLKKLVYFEIVMTADDVPPMTPFKFGQIQDRKVYDAANYIQAILTTDEFSIITEMMKSAKKK